MCLWSDRLSSNCVLAKSEIQKPVSGFFFFLKTKTKQLDHFALNVIEQVAAQVRPDVFQQQYEELKCFTKSYSQNGG